MRYRRPPRHELLTLALPIAIQIALIATQIALIATQVACADAALSGPLEDNPQEGIEPAVCDLGDIAGQLITEQRTCPPEKCLVYSEASFFECDGKATVKGTVACTYFEIVGNGCSQLCAPERCSFTSGNAGGFSCLETCGTDEANRPRTCFEVAPDACSPSSSN